ncbi:hypothetical protein [Saccharophagus degradans]|uniref:Uncharacterized protein n=1 Tax=Saccharophagus degradans (strain 2-40 / ATCC 43961 / DSM 17024) TaxID=203122 RepID=Q21G41_SACD2|nr:hypothetical protein [Saccharophagus degradans]ABD82338.1 conserved hypothetical protein [Saccharophagus degradans 2-40]
MNTLGIRAKPCSVIIAVYDTDKALIVNVEDIKIPKALPTPEALKYIRNSILDILREFKIEKAGLRVVESNSQTLKIRRIEIEGVIQEAFASSMLLAYFCGQISTITPKLNMKRADFKLYIDGAKVYDEVENWNTHSKEEKEAIFTALGAVHA